MEDKIRMNAIELIKHANNPQCALTHMDLLRLCWITFKIKVLIPIRYMFG